MIDIHTHDVHKRGAGVVCGNPEAVRQWCDRWPDGVFSTGIHPWETGSITPRQIEQQLELLEQVAALPQVRDIGETGLDRLRGADADMQEMIFRRHIELGEKLGKPIILHVVKSSDRLSAIRKELAPRLTTPWIWHGFRGKPQAALQFLSTATPQSPVYISLGEKFNYETAGIIPDSNLLAETDDAPTGITNVIRKLAEVRHTPEQHLTECISNNCTAILGGHTI